MRYPRIAARLFDTPLLVKPAYARTVAHVLSARLGVQVEAGETEYRERAVYDPILDSDGILTVPIVGGLYHRGDDLDAMSGAQSYTNLYNTMVQAMANEKVKGVLLDVDSPGGEAAGCFSFAESVRAFNNTKPVWAAVSGCACSAAYAITAAAGRSYAAADAEVGSIGVVWLHMDYSGAMKEAGVVGTFVYAGDHKIDGHPFGPMPEAARAEIQRGINDRYQQFVSLVAAYRPIEADQVRATQARVFLAAEAHELGLIDGVQSLEATRQQMAAELKPATTVVKWVEGKAVTWQD